MIHETDRRSRRHQRRSEELLDCALSLLDTEGQEAVSIHRIADRADYTPGALYRYFASKNELIAALITRVAFELAESMDETIDKISPLSPLDRLRHYVSSYRRYSLESPNRFQLLSTAVSGREFLVEDDVAAKQPMLAFLQILKPVKSAIEDAIAGGALNEGDAVERTLLVFVSQHGVLGMRKVNRRAPNLVDVDFLSERILEDLLFAWGAPRLPATVPPKKLVWNIGE